MQCRKKSSHRRKHNIPNGTRRPTTTTLKPSFTTLHQHNRKKSNGTPAATEYANHTSTSTVTTTYTSTNLQQPLGTVSDLQQQPVFIIYTRHHASTIGLYIQLPSTNLLHICYPQSCTPANCIRDKIIQASPLIACAATS